MKHKFVSLLFLTLLCLTLLQIFPHEVKTNPDFVTETSTEIIIKNDYFKAIFDKDPSNKHGHIRYFYIKPQDTVNIVSNSTWRFLGGHESMGRDMNDVGRCGTDWNGPVEKSSETVQIVYQSDTVVVIETQSRWKSYGNYLPYTNIEYTTFFSDKPYYIVSTTRTYHIAMKFLSNYEICFLFNMSWVNRYFWLNHLGDVSNTTGGMGDVIGAWEARHLGRYPWSMAYNDTYGKGYFTILVSANPPTIGIGAFVGAALYKEFQICYGDPSVEAGESHYLTYIAGVSDNATYVDDLSTSLYSTDVYKSEPFVRSVASYPNEPIWAQTLSSKVRAYTGSWCDLGDNDYPAVFADQWRRYYLYSEYKNNTDTYQLMGAPVNFTNFANGSYCKWSRQNDFQDKIRLNITFQFWNDSDPYLIKWNFTTLATLNITYFRVRLWSWSPTATTVLNSSVVKINYTTSHIPEQAGTFQNLTNIPREEQTVSDAIGYVYWYLLNGTEQEYSAGNSYIFNLQVQLHRRFSFENRGTFTLTDVLPLRQSINNRFEKLVWSKFPFFDNNTPFRINHYGGKNFLIYRVVRTCDGLSFNVVAPTGKTSTMKIYLGNKGKPKEILIAGVKAIEGINWTYSVSTKILVINTTHSSEINITIIFLLGDVNGDGIVDIYDLAAIGKAYGASEGDVRYNPDVDLNNDGIIDIYDLAICGKNYGKEVEP